MTEIGEHDHLLDGDKLFVFGPAVGIFLSICAPIAATKKEIEAFANAKSPNYSPYEAVNKVVFGDKYGIDMGAKTPNPCNRSPNARLHWFLVSVRFL